MKEIGDYLKKRRIDSGITLDEAEQFLKIRKKYLVAIEEGNEQILPGRTYFLGYLKNYANYLGADQEYIGKMLKGEGISDSEKLPAKKTVPIVDSEGKSPIPSPKIRGKKDRKQIFTEGRRARIKKEKKSFNFTTLVKIAFLFIVLFGASFIIKQFINETKESELPILQNEESRVVSDSLNQKTLEEELAEIAEENIQKMIEDDTIPETLDVFSSIPSYKPIIINVEEPTWIKIMEGETILFEKIILSSEEIQAKMENTINLTTIPTEGFNVIYDGRIVEPKSSNLYRLVSYEILSTNEDN